MRTESSSWASLARVICNQLGANISERDLRSTARLDDLLPLDSIALVELAVGLEAEFGMRFEPHCFQRSFFVDLPGLIAYLDRRVRVDPA